MDIKEFVSGHFVQQYKYKSFSPSKINIDWEISDIDIISMISRALSKLGELNAFSQFIPDIDFFIKMHISKEANQSSKIEGTKTNMEDILQKSENIIPEKRDDWLEVHNYIDAMNFAIRELENIPISTRLLRQTHSILMSGVRGMNKQPGEFRKSQNWIGGASLNDAFFIPPHDIEINDLMNDLEKFIHNENMKLPQIVKAGIMHYQFETIHPFLDGNGRIGRLLITLYLISEGLLAKPCLYLSDFFEKHRLLYYDNLSLARIQNDLTQWLKFFLEGVFQTAENSVNTFKKIVELRNDIEKTRISELGRKTKSAKMLLNYLYTNPIMEPKDVATALSINISTANRFIDDFVKLGILDEMTGFKRNRQFVFREYLEIFEQSSF